MKMIAFYFQPFMPKVCPCKYFQAKLMMASFFRILVLMLLLALQAKAQMQLSNFYPQEAAYADTVYIVGRGFGNNGADLLVSLGKARAEVASVSDQLIKVLVPGTASQGPITVSRASSTEVLFSSIPFTPVYRSDGFDFSHVGNATPLISEEEGLYDLCHCDFDLDNDQDIATVNNAEGASQTSVNVFSNTSTDPASVSFNKVPGTYFNINQPARNVTCGDLNGDGKPELIVSQGGNAAENIYIFQNTSSLSPAVINFSSPLILSSSNGGQTNGTRRLIIHDMDGDNLPEIIVSNQTAQEIIIFKNQSSSGSLSFPADQRKFLPVPANTLGLAVNDIDGDGKADIVASANLAADFFVFRNTSAEGTLDFEDAKSYSLSGQLANLSSDDIDGDGKQDLVLTDFEDGAILLLLNQSTPANIAFASPIRMNAAIQPWGVQLADITGNQKADIVVATLAVTDKVVILKNNSTPGDPNFELIAAGEASRYRNLSVAEINLDGKPDIIATEQDAFGNFQVTFIQNNSCIKAEISPAEPPAICEASPVLLSAPAALNASYQWLKDGSPISGATQSTYLAGTAGEYTVEVSDNDIGCSSYSDAVTVIEDSGSIPEAPAITAPTSICEGETLTLSTTNDPTLSYLWTGPNGFSSSEVSPSINNVSAAQAGTYQLEVKQGLCKSTVRSVFVDVVSTEDIELLAQSDPRLCPGESVTLSFDATDLSNLQWYRNDQLIQGESSSTLTTDQAGIYFVKAINTSSCTLSSNEISIETIEIESQFTLSASSVCMYEPISLVSESVYADQADVTYLWDFGDGSQSNETTPTHSYDQPGTYAISLTVSLGDGNCSSTSEQSITVLPFPEAEIVSSSDYLCPGDTLSLDILGDFASVSWEDGSTSRMRFISEPGTYGATVLNEQGCDSAFSISIEQKEIPTISVEIAGSSSIVRGDSVQLIASGADFYEWEPAEGLSDPNAANPFARPITTTTYRVTGYETNGCSTTEEVTVSVSLGRVSLDALSIFSPNGDGIEDTWVVNNIELYPDCQFIVFDLNGQEVYRSQIPYLNDWSGTSSNGIPLSSGAYYYVVRCGNAQNKGSGSVTIVR
jgi:gliding motility-associated-like protein